MTKKPQTSKEAVEKVLKNIRSKSIQLREISALSWRACMVRKASRCCAAVKGSLKVCIIQLVERISGRKQAAPSKLWIL